MKETGKGSAATDETGAREATRYLRDIERALKAKTFRPHPLFRSGHAQTLAAFAWPRRFKHRHHARDETRLFAVEPDVNLLAHCRWQRERARHPTLVVVHGLEGSSASVYMLSTANLAHRAGFNVLRLNQRTCGATEHLTPTLYNSSMSGDLAAVVRELAERDKLSRIYLAGFSMGGNLALKMAGELGAGAPPELRGVCAVSPALNLLECSTAIDHRRNWLYRQSFIRSLRRRVRIKQKLYPTLYDTQPLKHIRTLRQFDDSYTATHGGFRDADDYYERASALRYIAQIRTPTLIVHAQDDPLVPFASFNDPAIRDNPYVIAVTPAHGGHVAFLSAHADERERFWAENLLVEFCRRIEEADDKG
ncbi:MAG TPA: alpha/beta fold hydrolase [Pyrinomonadaceae bacterium]|jgi:predicted alpha/beta-fold hydrolase|nr:alpha/beta fold hydrolase [Pyrinomonadaceae bacterium]